jgi:hypothetical protein
MPFNLATAFVRNHVKNAASRGAMQQAGSLASGAVAAQAAGGESSHFSSLTGLGAKMQQEAGRQEMDQQLLAAQQEANGNLGALAGAAAGSALRVQVVGGQAGQW